MNLQGNDIIYIAIHYSHIDS